MFFKKKILVTSILFGFSIFLVTAQSTKSVTETSVREENLNKVLEHYQKFGDQQKYNIAKFLIENLPYHYSEEYIWIDEKGKNINFKETEYEDIEKAKMEFKKIEKSKKIYPVKLRTEDKDIITKEILIENIDLATNSWLNNPWAQSYSNEIFQEYILPYRSLTEPFENWRSEYKLIYQIITHKILDETDPVEVCTKIINEIKHFDFEMERYDPTPLLGPMELLFWREGNCPDLANVCLFACRSMGVAVTFDFTPYFAASSNKHFWNTVVDNKGEHIPFNGNQVAPYVYNANYRRMGKVFRNAFSIQNDNLSFYLKEEEIPEDFLKSKFLIDVTKEYVDVNDIDWKFKTEADHSIAYITVFNSGSWKIIDWSFLQNNKTTFKDMGRDIVYLPAIFHDKKIIFEQSPVLLDKNGKQIVLKANFTNTFKATLSRRNETPSEYEDYNPFDLENGKEYTLYTWNTKWQEVEKQIAKDFKITFTKIPENGLFLMAPAQPDFFERIFTIDKETGKITWY